MLVALSVDMEGISTLQDPFSILAFESSYWQRGRGQMTADAVAAARGLLDAGADEVVVLDNHGSGNPENIIGAELPSGARLESWNVFDLHEHGVEAMLQVGYHARAGIAAFVSHTYVPGLRLRVDGELISESHGRAWASRVPLLGIVGNDAHRRSLGVLSEVPYLVVQQTETMTAVQPAFADAQAAAAAIHEFSAEALRAGGARVPAPAKPLFEASLEPAAAHETMAGAGWQQISACEHRLQLSDWNAAAEPLAAAMGAAFAAWMGYFTTFELHSRKALERHHDEPVLERGREAFAAWLAGGQVEWLTGGDP